MTRNTFYPFIITSLAWNIHKTIYSLCYNSFKWFSKWGNKNCMVRYWSFYPSLQTNVCNFTYIFIHLGNTVIQRDAKSRQTVESAVIQRWKKIQWFRTVKCYFPQELERSRCLQNTISSIFFSNTIQKAINNERTISILNIIKYWK